MDRKIQFKSFDGSSLVGTLAGEGLSKRGVLLVHGLPSDKDEWGFYSDFARFLENSSVTSFRFDFRHCGESQAGSLRDVTMSEFVNDIDAAYWELCSRLSDGSEVYLVATSAGGGLSLKWLNTCGREVQKVFLMAPVLDYAFEVTGKRLEDLSAPPRTLDDASLQTLERNGCLNDDAGYGRQMLNDAINFNAVDEILTLQTEITIFHGVADSVVPVEFSRKAARQCPNVGLVEISGCDHGFAAPGDDDLTDPRTKANHARVFQEVLDAMQ